MSMSHLRALPLCREAYERPFDAPAETPITYGKNILLSRKQSVAPAVKTPRIPPPSSSSPRFIFRYGYTLAMRISNKFERP